jgi:hypothetical protein
MSQVYDDKTGRQDVAAPEATVEKSDPTPVDNARGQRMLIGVSLVAIVFLVIVVVVILAR